MASGRSVDYNFLGNSGLKVSNICLGAMTFGKMNDNGPMTVVCIHFLVHIILIYIYTDNSVNVKGKA